MNADINPYQAPSVAAFFERTETSPEVPFAVRAAERSYLRRRLVLARHGREWVVEYSGRSLRDTIRVNGRPVVRKMAWVWFVPRFEFSLDELPATIEVRISPLLAVVRFELRVAGRLVYEEFRKR
jgi:hypothetical protein